MTENWGCPRCSFLNHPDLKQCEMCDFVLLSNSLSIINANAPSAKEIIVINTPEKVESGIDNSVDGLLEMIINQGRNNPKVSYTVCMPSCSHISQKGSYGSAWSCGYRNIQILCSSLIKIKSYKAVLFDGDGIIPDIVGLQRWIERAWAAGFDREGAEQLGGRLLGTTTWIGATECAALLRYFGVRAVIVDFHGDNRQLPAAVSAGSKRSRSPSPAHHSPHRRCGSSGSNGSSLSERLSQWVLRYFQTRRGLTSSVPSCPAAADSSALQEEPFCPPLYFQHQGHSRTIAGLHYDISSTGSAAPELVNLIVFNPLSDARIAHASLSSGTQRWRAQLCKHRSSFAEDNYQLVCVSPGIMGGAERLRAQCLVGVSEHAPVA